MKFYHDELKRIIKKNGISKKYLINKMNIGRSTLYFWENGQRTPSISNLHKLAKYLNIKTEDISDIKTFDVNSNTKNSFDWLKLNHNSCSNFSNLDHFFNSIKERYSQMMSIINTISKANIGIYIKNINLNYIVCNIKLLDLINLPQSYNITNKTDKELFCFSEAAYNNKEDFEVLKYGKDVINREGFIPGTKKKKWGLISKFQLKNPATNAIEGIFSIIIDTTAQKKKEIINEILGKSSCNEFGLTIINEQTLNTIYFNEWFMQLFTKSGISIPNPASKINKIKTLVKEEYQQKLQDIYKNRNWDKNINIELKNGLHTSKLNLTFSKRKVGNQNYILEKFVTI